MKSCVVADHNVVEQNVDIRHLVGVERCHHCIGMRDVVTTLCNNLKYEAYLQNFGSIDIYRLSLVLWYLDSRRNLLLF